MILLSYLFNNNLYYCRFMYNIYQNVNNIKKTQFVFQFSDYLCHSFRETNLVKFINSDG